MALNTANVVDALVSLCVKTGLFRKVNSHEPKRAPDGDLTAAVYVVEINMDASTSGLSASSGVSVFNIRLYTRMLAEPPDAIDPALITATDTVIADLAGDFTLGTAVGYVDLRGASGVPVRARAGYLDIDGTIYRIMDITVPCVIFDAWAETA